MNKLFSFMAGAMCGALVGGVTALLLTPASGNDLRTQAMERWEMAKQEAEHAIDAGKVVTLRPMTARDRRVVHMSLADLDGIRTESSGEGMGRRIQIIPDGVEPRPIRGGGGGGRRRRR